MTKLHPSGEMHHTLHIIRLDSIIRREISVIYLKINRAAQAKRRVPRGATAPTAKTTVFIMLLIRGALVSVAVVSAQRRASTRIGPVPLGISAVGRFVDRALPTLQ